MFTVDPNITDLKIREKNLFKVLFSMNVHQVATPDLSVEDARSCVFFFRESGKMLSIIGLYFIKTDRRLYYSQSSNPFPEDKLSEIESEARAFAEDLGALLDELDFSKLSPEERNRWIDDQDTVWGAKPRKEPELPKQPAAPEKIEQPAAETAQAAAEQSAAPKPESVPPAPPTAAPVQPVQSQPDPVPAVPASVPPAVSPASAPSAAKQTQPLPARQKKAAPAPVVNEPAIQPSDPSVASAPRPDQVLDDAVKAGVVKAPKAQLKKEIRTAVGVVSRDKEALARLLASF